MRPLRLSTLNRILGGIVTVVLRMATRAEVMASPMADRVRQAVEAYAKGNAAFARESTPMSKRCVKLDVPSRQAAIWHAASKGWACVTGFLIAPSGHIFHV